MRPEIDDVDFRYEDAAPSGRAEEEEEEAGDHGPVPSARAHVRRNEDEDRDAQRRHAKRDELGLVVVLWHFPHQKRLIRAHDDQAGIVDEPKREAYFTSWEVAHQRSILGILGKDFFRERFVRRPVHPAEACHDLDGQQAYQPRDLPTVAKATGSSFLEELVVEYPWNSIGFDHDSTWKRLSLSLLSSKSTFSQPSKEKMHK